MARTSPPASTHLQSTVKSAQNVKDGWTTLRCLSRCVSWAPQGGALTSAEAADAIYSLETNKVYHCSNATSTENGVLQQVELERQRLSRPGLSDFFPFPSQTPHLSLLGRCQSSLLFQFRTQADRRLNPCFSRPRKRPHRWCPHRGVGLGRIQ